MLNLEKIEGTDIFEYAIGGKIQKTDIDEFSRLLEMKAKENQKIKLLGTMTEFPGIEDFEAFSATMKMKAKAIGNLQKAAWLTDSDWIENLVPIGDFVTPGIPIKQFDLDERDEAIAWLKKDEDKTVSEKEYLSRMNVGQIRDTDIYHFTIDGEIDEAGMTALHQILKDKNREGKINLIAYIKDFDGFSSVKAFFEGMKVDFAIFGNLEKFAILSDEKWIGTLAGWESKILPGITMKGFAEHEEEKALAWLKENK